MEGIPSTDKAICGDWKEKGRARPRADSRHTTSGGRGEFLGQSDQKQKEECVNMISGLWF